MDATRHQFEILRGQCFVHIRHQICKHNKRKMCYKNTLNNNGEK